MLDMEEKAVSKNELEALKDMLLHVVEERLEELDSTLVAA